MFSSCEGSLLELKLKAKERLALDNENVSELKVVLEVDGTEGEFTLYLKQIIIVSDSTVEDDSFFQTAEENTIFLILRPEETWLPLGVEALKAGKLFPYSNRLEIIVCEALSAIPGLVTDALNKLDASDKLPSWKVSDDQGVITVVLSWDTRERPVDTMMDGESDWCLLGSGDQQIDSAPEKPNVTPASSSFLVHETEISSIPQEASAQAPLHSARAKLTLEGLGTRSQPRQVPIIQHSFLESEVHLEFSDSDEDVEDGEGIFPCDFHCSALHSEVKHPRKLSVATSPISHSLFLETFVVPTSGTTRETSKKSGKYVRFQEVDVKSDGADSDSETETETTEKEDEQLNYLILVDQQKGLSIKDVGIILERLKGTILGKSAHSAMHMHTQHVHVLDVDKLERETTDMSEYHWTIRALTRGKFTDVGVIHNGIFYGIGEHPAYF